MNQAGPIETPAAPAATAKAAPLELAIVLPTLNEAGNIAPLIARLEAALGPAKWEAIVVDDDSDDGTAEEARALARGDRRIRVMQRIGRRGLASAAIEGMCATAAPFVAVMDADHQHDPALLPAMLEAVRDEGYDLAYASRFAPGASASGLAGERRQRGSALANALARRLTGTHLTDPMSGYFLLRAEGLRRQAPRLSGIGFKLMLDILASAPRPLKVKELPLTFAPRLAGASKLDEGVLLDFLAGLYERWLGRIVPTRFALFGTVGATGVLIHMLILAALLGMGTAFPPAQAVATLTTMTFNFWLNNLLTYRDRRLSGWSALVRGWLSFCGACAIGAFANVAVASLVEQRGAPWWLAALAGIALASVWNFALSSRFVWGRFR